MKQTAMEIHGTIIAMERDRAGDVIQVAIEDDNMQRYLILGSDQSSRLFPFVNQRIVVHASIVEEDLKGRPIVRLIDFSKENQ